MLWRSGAGMVNVDDVIAAGGGDLTGWSINDARGSSRDGRVLVGTGIHNFGSEAWVATLARFCGTADFNCDGAVATDADIEAFFACLSGNCPPDPCASSADFNGDGAVGTDGDIEAFFRVLAGGTC